MLPTEGLPFSEERPRRCFEAFGRGSGSVGAVVRSKTGHNAWQLNAMSGFCLGRQYAARG